jgi:hypothetical protein
LSGKAERGGGAQNCKLFSTKGLFGSEAVEFLLPVMLKGIEIA